MASRSTPFLTARLLPYALLVGSAAVIAGSALVPEPGKPVAAVFPPWWNAAHSVASAASIGVPILRSGGLPAIVVLQPEATETLNALARRAHEAGAWFVINAKVFGGCTLLPDPQP